MPKKYSEEVRQSFCAKWKSSGQSKVSFCKENGISGSALHKWLTRFEPVLSSSPSLTPPSSSLLRVQRNKKRINFLPVEVANKTAKNHEVEILLPNGILLKTEVTSIALLAQELTR